jgi:hypothetical protein
MKAMTKNLKMEEKTLRQEMKNLATLLVEGKKWGLRCITDP